MTDLRTRLRAVPTLTGKPPAFDPARTPGAPHELFVDWLTTAIDSGVPEPCATTLSTVDETGRPSGRILILKNVDERGWQFASSAGSRKGRELATHPQAALTFYWVPLGRQVRITGTAKPADPAESLADLMARPPAARTQADWTLYTLDADEVEFWQADPDRNHLRLRYDRSSDGAWTKGLL
jgi:pyridoxamine 5'-phosphate oxidase